MYVYALKQRERDRDCNFETIGIFSNQDVAECEMNKMENSYGKWYEFEIEYFMLDEI